MMNINIQIANGARFFHNGREIVVILKEKAANYLKSKAHSHLPLIELAEIHSAIERQEPIRLFSGSLIVTSCEPS
jgi:hypothetical protein